MSNRVHISRQGSIDVTNIGGGTSSYNSNLHISSRPDLSDTNLTQELLRNEAFSGTVTFRDRAKNAIERTLSPGSEFSFSSGSRLVDVETGVSLGKLENLLRQQDPDQTINDYAFGMTDNDKSKRLKNLETELLQTKRQLQEKWERLDKHVSSPLAELQKQLSGTADDLDTSTADRLLKRRNDEEELTDVRVRDELNQTLRRLESAANREGALRMENYYLRSNAGRGESESEKQKKLQAEMRRARQQEETKNNVSNRNLILKCAMLEEKLEQSEVKCRRAETTMEALIQQLRHLRRSRSEEALQKEQKLYSRLEENMANIFDVSGPLLQQEQNAHSRHEAIATHLTQIDSVLRRQVAALKVKVKKLEGENSSLKEELNLRPKLKDYKYLLYRENALHNVIKKNVNKIDFDLDKKNKKSNVKYDGDRDAYVEETNLIDGEDSPTRRGILKDRSLNHVDANRMMEAQERVGRFVKTEEARHTIKGREETLFSGPVPVPTGDIMILWASNSILRDIMDMLDIKKPNDIYQTMKDLSNSKRLHGAMKVYVEKVTALVQRATKVKVGQIYKAYKSADDDATKPDIDPKDHANNLKTPENVMTLNDSYASLKQQLQERKAMAFSQTQPQLIVHKILVQFQMLLNVDAGDRIITALQNLITKLRISKMVLRKIRALFGLPQTTNNDEDLLEVIETYVRNLGFYEMSSMLLDNGASLSILNRYNMTPFEIASENSTSFEFVMLFLKGGEDGDDSGFQFKRRSEKGLLCACQYGRLKTVQQLIDKIRVDRQCSDSDGNTCLHLATQFGHDDVVKLLLKRGVSKKRENKLGETPFEVGKKYGKTLCCEILELPFGAF
eukprot:g1887.t1